MVDHIDQVFWAMMTAPKRESDASILSVKKPAARSTNSAVLSNGKVSVLSLEKKSFCVLTKAREMSKFKYSASPLPLLLFFLFLDRRAFLSCTTIFTARSASVAFGGGRQSIRQIERPLATAKAAAGALCQARSKLLARTFGGHFGPSVSKTAAERK